MVQDRPVSTMDHEKKVIVSCSIRVNSNDFERWDERGPFTWHLCTYVCTIWCITTKCGKVTHMGRGVLLCSQPRPIPRQWGPSISKILGDLPTYTTPRWYDTQQHCTMVKPDFTRWSNQIRGKFFTESTMPLPWPKFLWHECWIADARFVWSS